MPNGSWQPDPYGRHQMRWWDGVQWTSMVSDNGVPRDENLGQQLPPMQQPPVQQQMMGVPMVPMVPTVAQQPTAPRRNTTLIAIVAAAVLVVAGLAVFLLTRDDGGDTATPGSTQTTAQVTTATLSTTAPTTPVTGSGGRDSQTPEGQAYVDAMMQSAGDSGFSNTEARCIAEGSVDIVGVQRLQEMGVTPEMVAAGEELLPEYVPTEAEANALLDVMFGCADFGALMASEMGAGVLTQEQTECIGNGIETDETYRAFLISTMISSASETETSTMDDMVELQLALIDIMTSCGVDTSGFGD